jgi:hypothetical protein
VLPALNFGHVTGYADWVFLLFHEPFQANIRFAPRLGQNRFLPNFSG